MSAAPRLAVLLFDPGGRVARGEFLFLAAAAVSLAAASAVSPSSGSLTSAASGIALWIAYAAVAKRLHDLDRSAWWAIAAAGALCMWTALLAMLFLLMLGVDGLAAGSGGMAALTGLVGLPAIGFLLWLHGAAGAPHVNRYGSARSARATPARFA